MFKSVSPLETHSALLDRAWFHSSQAHHAMGDSYTDCLVTANILRVNTKSGGWEHNPDCKQLLLGFSATPFRLDKQDPRDLFNHLVFSISIQTLMEEGHLCKLETIRIMTEADLSKVHETITENGDDYNERQLSEVGPPGTG